MSNLSNPSAQGKPGGGKLARWNMRVSEMAKNTLNPIRRIVDGMVITPNPEKELIRLTIGDPTVFGNLDTAEEVIQAAVSVLQNGKHNGYPPSVGSLEARQAVADYSTAYGAPVTAQDVVLTSGCSQSLELVMNLLANPGQNILVPNPCFPLYTTLAHSVGIETKPYNLKPEDEWKVDLESLESQIDEDTVAVIVNSPSNPCGGVFSKEHIQQIIDVCAHYKLPIISDEVYEHVVFNGATHYPFAAVSADVPIFSVSSISKRFLVPGWRLGWIIVHDRQNSLPEEIRSGLTSLTQRTLAPCSLLQGALPALLKFTPTEMFDRTNRILEENANIFYEVLSTVRGLTPIRPSGSMYIMVKVDIDCFPDFKSDVDFTQRLISEMSVFCLPGSCFSYPNYFRIVLSVPQDKAIAACERIKDFCESHFLHYIPDSRGDDVFTKRHQLNRITSTLYLQK